MTADQPVGSPDTDQRGEGFLTHAAEKRLRGDLAEALRGIEAKTEALAVEREGRRAAELERDGLLATVNSVDLMAENAELRSVGLGVAADLRGKVDVLAREVPEVAAELLVLADRLCGQQDPTE